MKKPLLLVFVMIGVFLSSQAFSAELNLSVDGFVLVSKKRVSRTDIEYTYKADITNNDTALEAINVIATMSSTSPNTTIIDGVLNVDAVPANSSAASKDTFSIRQNRRYPFNPSSISWTFSGVAVPPDPGEAGKATLAGIDSDNDGVRDDVQRYIEITYHSENPDFLKALFNYVKISQKMILEADDKEKTIQNASAYSDTTDCIDYLTYPDVAALKAQGLDYEAVLMKVENNGRNPVAITQKIRAILINTEERYLQNIEASKRLSGGFYGGGDINEDLSKYCK